MPCCSLRLGILDEINASATLAIEKSALEAPETHTSSAAFARWRSRAASATLPACSFFINFAGDSVIEKQNKTKQPIRISIKLETEFAMLKLTCHMASQHTSTFLLSQHHGTSGIPRRSVVETDVLSCTSNNGQTRHDGKDAWLACLLAHQLHLMHVCSISEEQSSIKEPSYFSSPPKYGSSISQFLLSQNVFRNHKVSISLVIKQFTKTMSTKQVTVLRFELQDDMNQLN